MRPTPLSRIEPQHAVERAQTALFVIVPIAVSMLFAGAVYWMKQSFQPPAGPISAEPVQVQILGPSALAAPVIPQRRTLALPDVASKPPALRTAGPPAIEVAPPSSPAIEAAPPVERPATVAVAPAPPDLFLDAVTAEFRRAVSAKLARFKRYPRDALTRGAQGAAVVRFTVGRNGSIGTVALVKSSGDAALDQEALATVSRAQPFPRIPAGLPERMALMIPVNFSLR